MSRLTLPQSERQIQREILRMIGICFPQVFVHHSPNGGHLAGDDKARSKQVGALKGDGMKAGFPDLICLWNGGGALLEVKSPNGRLTGDQPKVHEALSAIGWPVAIVRSQQDAWDALVQSGLVARGEWIG